MGITKLKKVKNFFHKLFNPAEDAKKLYIEIGQQRVAYSQLRAEFKALQGWNTEYSNTLNYLTRSMKALVWSKDSENKYTLANPLHCSQFFGMEATSECLEYIKGKTDEELIKSIFHDNGIENTFGKICVASDNYTRDKREICHFIEAATVDEECVLLYVVKTPCFSQGGEFIGTVGIGWDFTEMSAFWTHQLKRWVFDGKAVKISCDKDVFVYSITPEIKKCDIFRHICLRPETERENCNGECRTC